MRWLDGITNLMDMALSKLRDAWYAAVHGIAKSQTQLNNSTELKAEGAQGGGLLMGDG